MTPEQGIADAAIWCPTAENLSEEEATQRSQDTQGERKGQRKGKPGPQETTGTLGEAT